MFSTKMMLMLILSFSFLNCVYAIEQQSEIAPVMNLNLCKKKFHRTIKSASIVIQKDYYGKNGEYLALIPTKGKNKMTIGPLAVKDKPTVAQLEQLKGKQYCDFDQMQMESP